MKQYQKVWALANKEKLAAANLRWRLKNPEKAKLVGRQARKNYHIAHKDEINAATAAYQKANPAKVNAWQAKRRAAKLNRTPKWLTVDQLKEVESFYALAKELQWLANEPLEVDHIVPLQGDNVSGLHVPWNLQILPKSLNISKGNR